MMLETLGTNPSWLGIATISAVISLIYVFGQILWFVWKRRGVLARGISAYRAARLRGELEDLKSAVRDRQDGYSDLAVAMIARRKIVKGFIGVAIGFIFLITTSVAATLLTNKALIVTSLCAVIGNLFFDITSFAKSIYYACWLVRGSYRPDPSLRDLEQRIDRIES